MLYHQKKQAQQHNSRYYLIPREHGGWSVLLIPAVLGAVAAGRINIQYLLFLISILFFYLARYPLSVFIKRWIHGGEVNATLTSIFVIYLSLGFALFTPLILYWKLYMLLFFGALVVVSTLYYLFFIVPSSTERSWGAEIIGVLTLCLSAPASYYVCGTSLNKQAILLYVLCVLYFTGPVFYVKMMVEMIKTKGADTYELKRLKFFSIAYHIFCIPFSLILSYLNGMSILFSVAFIPPLIKVALSVINRRPIPIRRLGYREIAHSILFLIIASLSLIQ